MRPLRQTIPLERFQPASSQSRSHKWPGLHEASNLILACGSGDTGCHGWIHAHPREAMSLGYIVSGFNDHPELVPILTAQHGWVLLDDKGGWMRCEPPKQ